MFFQVLPVERNPDGKVLINDLSFSVLAGEVMGIVGDEGVGKSTLLNILSGKASQHFTATGQWSLPAVRYFHQSLEEKWKDTEVFKYFFKDDPQHEVDAGIWNEYNSVSESMARVGLDSTEFLTSERTLRSLSGGEASRVRLAKLFFQGCKTLFLDEPTNNMDLRTIKWLEGFLREYEHPVVVVSHDEAFLEEATTKILYLQKQKGNKPPLFRINGNGYREFQDTFKREVELTQKKGAEFEERQKQMKVRMNEERQKSASRDRKQKPQDAAEKARKRRGMANATKQRARVESQVSKERAPEVILANEEFRLPIPDECALPAGKMVCDLVLDQLSINDKILGQQLKLQVNGNEKVIIQGDNGVGKSTFLGKVREHLEAKEEQGIRVGYLPQDYFSKAFKPGETALALVERAGASTGEARGLLARLGLDKDSVDRSPNELSSGQLCKVFIASLIAKKANILILDEPTNNLYPLTTKALSDFISEFPGAMIAISHDRKFTESVASTIYNFEAEKGLVRLR